MELQPRVYFPLQGPDGVKPKAPAVGAWQSPGYAGVSVLSRKAGEWIGMRCDRLVVVDCDSKEAAAFWRTIDPECLSGWVRQTPRGMHYLYLAGPGSPEGPAVGVWPEIDIRAGRTSQIVMFAEGYYELHAERFAKVFNPTWLPETFGSSQVDRSSDESWDEVPDGRGNNTMTAFAGAFRKQGMSMRKIATCLGAINRICMTDDPMPTAMIVEITKSVCRYAPAPDVDITVEP